jgi:hypothetical protein
MSNYYLWRDGVKSGPYSVAAVSLMLHAGAINGDTLWCMDGGPDEWSKVKDCAAFAAKPVKRTDQDAARGQHEERVGVIEKAGERFVLGAKLLGGFGAVALFLAWFSAKTGDTVSADVFIFCGGCIGVAAWLYLIGQVVLIRAAIERGD